MILDCTDANAFRFTDDGVSALDWNASLTSAEEAREYFMGFGSCSIEEPLDTLRAIGLVIN
jgi:hypothetical protein